ncbi:hypothetical protein [Variovorax sp.]|uniref:hypothetical protein n=1 Tax=Variovorax sp. TaxID=1871043 RepID=UPI003BA9B90B
MSWFRLALIAIVVALAGTGLLMVRAHWLAEGGAKVQQRWDARDAADSAAAAANALELQRLARRSETLKQQQTERIARDLQDRNALLAHRNGTLDARNRELLGTIAALDADDAALDAVPGAPAHAGAPRAADGRAAVAREVLGRCSGRYAAVATDAARFASQVIGLQQYATVCQAATQSDGAGQADGDQADRVQADPAQAAAAPSLKDQEP